MGDGRHQYFFGNAASLAVPAGAEEATNDPEAEEEIGDRWAANPLRYALQPGQVLGVYDMSVLAPYVVDAGGDDYEAYGTLLVESTPEQVAGAQLTAIDLVS